MPELVEVRGKGLVEVDDWLYMDDQRAAVTWEHFREMFRAYYIPQVEHERLS